GAISELQAYSVMAPSKVRGPSPVNCRAVTSASRLRFCALRSGNWQLETFCFAKRCHRGRGADALAGEQPMEIIDAMHRLAIERDDDVARLESCPIRRAAGLYRRDQHAARLHEAMRAHREARQRHILPAHP